MRRKFISFTFSLLSFVTFGQMDFSELEYFINQRSGMLFEQNPEHFIITSYDYSPVYYDGFWDSICNRIYFERLSEFFFYTTFDTNASHPAGLRHPNILEQELSSMENLPHVTLGLMDFYFDAIDSSAFTSGALSMKDSISMIVTLDTGYHHLRDTIYDIDTTTIPSTLLALLIFWTQ